MIAAFAAGRHPDPLSHRRRDPALEDDALRRPERRRVRRRELQPDRVRLPERRTATTRTSRSTSPTIRPSSTASRPKYDNLWLDTANYANYANITGPPARALSDLHEGSGAELSAAGRLRAADPQALRRGDAEDRRDHVPHHGRAAHQRDDRGACSAACRCGSSARRRSTAIPRGSGSPTTWIGCRPPASRCACAAHAGLNHQKLVILYGQAMAVFGSSNWTTPSANLQQEHNYFTTKPWMFQWFVDQFERKWNNLAPNGAIETGPFTPLPPDKPVLPRPRERRRRRSRSRWR